MPDPPAPPPRGFFAALPESSFAAWLLGITVGLRLALLAPARLWLRHGDPVKDIVCHFNEPHVIATRLLNEGCFCSPFLVEPLPTAHSSPLYVGLLAATQAWIGACGTADYVHALLAYNLVSAVATVLLLWRLARRVADEATARRAALLWAVLPIGLVTSWCAAYSAPHDTALFLAMLLAMRRLVEVPGAARAAQAGLLAGLATLNSPTLGPCVAMAWIYGAWQGARGPAAQRSASARALLIAAVVGALSLAPWAARNQVALGGFAPTRSNFGLELDHGNHPRAVGGRWVDTATDDDLKVILAHSHPSLNPDEKDRLRALGELAYSRARKAEALERIESHPAWFLALTARRVLVLWFDDLYLVPGGLLHDLTRPARWGDLISFAILPYLTLLAAARGLLRLGRARRAEALLLGALLLLGPAPYTITNALFRYKLPFVPLLLIAAAIGLARDQGAAKRP